jgi:hypothetical protein
MRRFLLQFLFFVGVLNFLTFWFAAVYLGGDAVNGRAVGDHYFLSNHGYLHEVSKTVFTYSKWHVYSVFVTHPVAILSAWFLKRDSTH